MKKESVDVKKIVTVSLFWGALWGITEATLGYLAHLVLVIPTIAGFIMFPIGFYFMTRAYKETGKLSSLFSTAGVAASIKLVDLFLPNLSPIKTINPAASILLESVVVILILKAMARYANTKTAVGPGQFRFKEAFAAAAGWRIGFVMYFLLLFALSISGEFFQMGTAHILRFLLLESVINAVIITAYLKTAQLLNQKKTWPLTSSWSVRPAISAAVFTAAILVKLVPAVI